MMSSFNSHIRVRRLSINEDSDEQVSMEILNFSLTHPMNSNC